MIENKRKYNFENCTYSYSDVLKNSETSVAHSSYKYSTSGVADFIHLKSNIDAPQVYHSRLVVYTISVKVSNFTVASD